MGETLLVPCECCGTEGRIYREHRPRWSEPVEIDCGPCPACGETGLEEIEAAPVTGDDDNFFVAPLS